MTWEYGTTLLSGNNFLERLWWKHLNWRVNSLVCHSPHYSFTWYTVSDSVTFLASEDMWLYDSWATRSGRSISALVVTGSNDLEEQHYTKELSVMMEMVDVCLGQYSSHLLWVAFEQRKCGWLVWRWAVSRKWTPDFQNWIQTSKGKNISLIIYVDYNLKDLLSWVKHFIKINFIFLTGYWTFFNYICGSHSVSIG